MGPILIDERGVDKPLLSAIDKPLGIISLRDAVVLTLQYILAYTNIPDTNTLSTYLQQGIFSNQERYGIALNMLLDLPITANLLFDILTRNRVHCGDVQNTVLDLGTGSGILGFAGYLHLKKYGIKAEVVGIENQPSVAQATDLFFKKLGIGRVERANSTADNILETTGVKPYSLSWVMNENLGHPRKHVHKEPFLDNLWQMKRCGADLSKTNLFPHGIKIENCGTKPLPTFLSGDNDFGGVFAGENFRHPSIVWTHLKTTPDRAFRRVGCMQEKYYGFTAHKFFNPAILRYLPARWIDYSRK